jgi:lysophospholipase L1-like esterase
MSRGKGSRSKAKARSSLRRVAALAAAGFLATLAAALVVLSLPTRSPSPGDAVLSPQLEQVVHTTGSDAAPEVKDAGAKPGKLSPFYAALLKLQSGTATKPLTILHLGDSHIASDRITGEVRRLLQARFGDAGRGLMMPGFPFPYYEAPGFSFEKKGDWKVANSLTDEGTYGITGVSLTASGDDAELSLSSLSGPFASAEVSLLKGPGQGRAVVVAGERREEVATAADTVSVLRVALPVKATSLKVEVVGDGKVTVLGWSVNNGKTRGVRYVNLGIPSASALTTSRFDRALATSDIEALAPDLVILGYGTNEGFNDDLDLAAYERNYERLIALVQSAAPNAALVILGPIDGNRLPRFVKGEERASAPCRPLDAGEEADYSERLARDDAALARWHEPPKLDAVRSLLARIAGRHGATYWNLSRIMGGPCSMDRWLHSEPPLAYPDHVHLNGEGSRRIGRAIYDALLSGYERYRQQASAAGSLASADKSARPPVEEP